MATSPLSTSLRLPSLSSFRPWCQALLGAGMLLAATTVPVQALEGMIGIHDPSTVIECDGTYYAYGTGRGISALKSTNGFDWERGTKVFDTVPETVRSYVPKNDGKIVWAPDIIKLNGEYYLYYSISVWGEFVSAVGLMTSPTLDPTSPNYKWTDRGMVVHSSEGENLNAIDPGVTHAPDGTLWICYGSYHGTIELVELNPKTGLRIAPNSPVTVISKQSEASDIIFHDGYYYLFVNHGSCCKGAESTYHIRVGRSRKVTGPYLDKQGEDLADGAGTLFLAAEGKNIGPGHFGLLQDDGVEKFSCHYEAVIGRNGRSVLDIRPLLWTLDGWPMPGKNIEDGIYQVRSQKTGNILQGPTAATTDARPVQTSRYNVLEHQKWAISPAGGGFYKILSMQTGSALSATDADAKAAPFTGADEQLWKIDQLTDGSYRVASKVKKLALSQLKTGNDVGLSAFISDDAQRWIITAP